MIVNDAEFDVCSATVRWHSFSMNINVDYITLSVNARLSFF